MSGRRQFGSIRQMPSGRYQVRYRDTATGDLIPASKTFTTKKEANLYLSRLQTDAENGTVNEQRASTLTIKEYSERWLAAHHTLRPRTRENYESCLRLHILPDLGQIELGKLTPSMVREWHSKLSSTRLAPATVSRSYRILKAMCSTALTDELIHRNPCTVRGASASRSDERPTATLEEVWKLADAIDARYKALVLLATFTGLRLGELLALTRSEIHLTGKAPYVAVRRQVFELANGTHQFGPPKTQAGRRDVTLPPPLIPHISEHVANWAEPGPEGLLFTAPTGGLVRRSNLHRRYWAPAVEIVGLAGFHFHDLRHTGNTLAAMTGASTRELMSRMGHASPRAALIYQHATKERDIEIAERLGAMFATGTSPDHPREEHCGQT